MKTQIITCLCGKTFASYYEPECYADAKWQRDMRKYIKRGCKIELIELSNLKLEKCTCKNMKPPQSSDDKIQLPILF